MKNIIAICAVAALAACGGSDKKGEADCLGLGTACTDSAGCCSNNCDPTALVCSHVPGTCGASGDDCATGPDCCSFRCENFQCSGDQCVADGGDCSSDGQCCGGVCGGGKCTPLNPVCKTSGNTCANNSECCGHYCNNGLCSNSVSFCIQSGDTCAADTECCGGLCQKAMGATLGTCELVPSSGATGCASMGEVCGAGANYDGGPLPTCGGECCSRACFPAASGALVCQPPSGCRPTGELCAVDQDCCGSDGLPDGNKTHVKCRKEPGFNLGRCDNGNMCAPAGAICRLQTVQCNATDNCCAGNVQQFDTCHQDSLGIPRCGGAGGTCTYTPGMACSSSADCCNMAPCVPTPGSEFGFVCGSTQCQMTGAACTTNADCCSGLPCDLPPGASQGTCGTPGTCVLYGQSCTAGGTPCCDNVACNGGYCINDIL
jgi:hypothetical protein